MMKLKKEVKSWNNYPLGYLIDLPYAQGQFLMGVKLFSRTTKCQNILSPKINLFVSKASSSFASKIQD